MSRTKLKFAPEEIGVYAVYEDGDKVNQGNNDTLKDRNGKTIKVFTRLRGWQRVAFNETIKCVEIPRPGVGAFEWESGNRFYLPQHILDRSGWEVIEE